MGIDIHIYLDIRQSDGTWRATQLPHPERDYKFFEELGYLGTKVYDDILGKMVVLEGVVERRGLPDGFKCPNEWEDPVHDRIQCLTPYEFGKAFGRILSKRGWIGRTWTTILFTVAGYDWGGENDDGVRLVYWFS